MWRTAFKNLKWYGLYSSNILKAVLYNLYMVHSWIPWPIWKFGKELKIIYDCVLIQSEENCAIFDSVASYILKPYFEKMFSGIVDQQNGILLEKGNKYI